MCSESPFKLPVLQKLSIVAEGGGGALTEREGGVCVDPDLAGGVPRGDLGGSTGGSNLRKVLL